MTEAYISFIFIRTYLGRPPVKRPYSLQEENFAFSYIKKNNVIERKENFSKKNEQYFRVNVQIVCLLY